MFDFVLYIKTAIQSKHMLSVWQLNYHLPLVLDSANRHLKEMANWKDWFNYLMNYLSLGL